MLGRGEEYTTVSAKVESSVTDSTTIMTTRKKKRNKNTRRFSDEQIRSLEFMFESESKLEPQKKLQMARELGLQPRQVAIWFQNRRARWKSKQLERDYSILRTNFDTLASKFESMKKEKQSLLTQLQKLSDLLEKSQKESRCCGSGLAGNSTDGDSENGDTKCESDVKPRLLLEGSDHRVVVGSDDEKRKNPDYFGKEEEADLLHMAEPTDGSLTSPENWCSFDSDGLLDQSCSSSQWWDFLC
ncbi:hypothetical protein HHK36_027408 [Tetracentron sinense]|uniref:Homeobox-leucine zipper protein n=1 Tax=Tetracentron sinense TaxID=13715 RepID=A0A834YD01_TETSI|nr:hypothetical protein HHK36_027408 [Tetracentron sinense]